MGGSGATARGVGCCSLRAWLRVRSWRWDLTRTLARSARALAARSLARAAASARHVPLLELARPHACDSCSPTRILLIFVQNGRRALDLAPRNRRSVFVQIFKQAWRSTLLSIGQVARSEWPLRSLSLAWWLGTHAPPPLMCSHAATTPFPPASLQAALNRIIYLLACMGRLGCPSNPADAKRIFMYVA